jgi:fanconi anemia group J protein
MGVCRGSLSEGIDFSDDMARLVIVIGVPNPSFYAAEIVLKMKFLDSSRDQISGNEWYT